MRIKVYKKDIQSALQGINGLAFWGTGTLYWNPINNLHQRLLKAQAKLGLAPNSAYLTMQFTKDELRLLCKGLTELEQIDRDNPQAGILDAYDRAFHDKICDYLKWLDEGKSIPDNLNQQRKKP